MLKTSRLYIQLFNKSFKVYPKSIFSQMTDSNLDSVPKAQITVLNYDTDFDSFTDSSTTETIITPSRKKPKLEKKVSPFKLFFENDIKSYSYNEISMKLKSLLNELSEHHTDKKHVFEQLTNILDTNEDLNEPIPAGKSQYFAHTQASSVTEPVPAAKVLSIASAAKITEQDSNGFKSPVNVRPTKRELDCLFSSSPVISKVIDIPNTNAVSSSPIITNHPEVPVESENAEPLNNTQSSPLKQKKPVITEQRRQYGTLHMATQVPDRASPTPKPEDSEKHVKAITLSKEQEIVIQLAEMGENIFYTGSAGTGKSLLLRELIKKLRDKHPEGTVGVTASTGLAAYNIGGMTINSFAGIGLGVGTPANIAAKIKRLATKKELWKDLRVLIIDEVSMIDGELLDKLDVISQIVRENKKPFGGVQVILCGDFYQLPPVSKTGRMKFAFESEFWKNHIKTQVLLQKVFRQQGDKQFLQMLQEVRDGKVSPSTVKKFKALERPLSSLGGLIPTKLFPTRVEVDRSNHQMISKLEGDGITFTATDTGKLADTPQGQKILESFLAPKSITLKIGAQVMMIKNIDSTLVNGSLGNVVGFLDKTTYETVQSIDSDIKKRLDTDSSIFNRLVTPTVDLEDTIFDFLAESKALLKDSIKNEPDSIEAKNDSDTSLLEYEKDKDEVDEEIRFGSSKDAVLKSIESKEQLLRALRENGDRKVLLPLVCFRLSNGATRTVAVEEEEFSVEDEHQHVIVKRSQIPLMLAWALSIHKSQGQTLKYACVDLRKIFENGQAYVALSRAEHRRGLQVLNFDPKKITTNPKVIEFYKNLKNAETSINNYGNENRKSYNSDVPTQIRDIHEHTATPERFERFRKPQKAKKQNSGGMDIMKMLNQTRKQNSQSDKENEPPQETVTKKVESAQFDLSADIMGSDDDSTSFQKLFENK